jgi:hypothetical protein
MLKKLAGCLCVALILMCGSAIVDVSPNQAMLSIGYAAPKAKIIVHRDTAWFDRDNRTFGAAVSFDGAGETDNFTVAYKMESNGNGDDIYQSKNNSGWVYIGTHGPDKQDYNFPSRYSIQLFVSVANVCAQTQGYDHMF